MILGALTAATAPAAVTVSTGEMAQERDWAERNLLTATNIPPFSFIHHGQPSSALLPSWARVESHTTLDTDRTQHVLTWANAGIPHDHAKRHV